jgi:hypothetical protein
MRTGIGLVSTFAGVFLALLLQQALPAIHVLHGARFVFVPMIFCLAAMALPFPAMLAAAFFTGFLCDLMYLHVVGGRVEIALGCSIVFFVIYGSIANGFRPSWHQGRWWPLIPVSAVGTSAYLLMQFLMLSLRREGFEFDEALLWRVFAPGALAALLAPVFYAGVRPLSALLPAESILGRGF